MPEYVRATVTGGLPVRDAITRESVGEGGEVRLLVRPADGNKPPRCNRHPRKGTVLPQVMCTCAGTLLEPLIASGSIDPDSIRPFELTAAPAKDTKAV
jgi:hypothetical protein